MLTPAPPAVLELPVRQAVSFVATRRRLRPDDAHDLASLLTLKLLADDGAVLRRFRGRSSPVTYLAVVADRVWLDAHAAHAGKWRPSSAARRAGPVALLLERLLVRDGLSADEAVAFLRANHGVAATDADVARIRASLPPRARRRFVGEEPLAQLTAAQGAADERVLARDRRRRATQVREALGRVVSRLPHEDRELLRARFVHGGRIADFARRTGADQKQLYVRLDRLLRGLRTALAAQGVTTSVVGDLVGTPEGESIVALGG